MRALLRRIRHRLEYLLVRAARGIDRVLGPRRSAALASALGRFVYRRLRIRARVVEEQLRAAFPGRDEAWIRATARAAYEHLGREAMMLIRLSRLGPEAVVQATEMVEGWDELTAAMEEGRGAVAVTGHYGNWEICGSATAARGIPVDAVARRQDNPLVDRLINRARERLGMTIIPMGGATKAALRSLQKGHLVGLVADQDARQRGVFVPFFGRPASTFRGPAILAVRTGAPLFVSTAARHPDGHYRVRYRRIPIPETAGPAGLEWEITAAVAAELESHIREDPTQYLWHHRRWKTRPPVEEPTAGPSEAPAAADRGAGGADGPGRDGGRGNGEGGGSV